MEIEQKVIKTLRKISLEQIYFANSGHSGIALGATNILYAVYKSAKINPQQPNWISRDRIILSAGHGSALLYSVLHLFGFLGIEDLQSFRNFGGLSGHPEITINGVDCSTGALGQGIANAVGMCLAEKFLANKYNDKNKIIDNYTFCICGDGDLMEGISYESASFAGKNKLNKLILLYDANRNTLDSKLSDSFNEDVEMRFKSQGWNVYFADGNNLNEIENAIENAKNSDKPNLIICQTTIGYGSTFADKNLAHSNPFNENSFLAYIRNLGLSEKPFEIDQDVYEFCNNLIIQKQKDYNLWLKCSRSYASKHPKKYRELTKADFNQSIKKIKSIKFKEDVSTRVASNEVLQVVAQNYPNLFGGSADVAEATKAKINDEGYFSPQNLSNRNICFGVREFAMSAICNGLALYSNTILPFASTFLVFSDYAKSSIRMSALMNLKLMYIFTHDSIAVGEDGSTHQPVEQLESLRLIPNLNVFRPSDANETIAGYLLALKSNQPTALILSRQKLPALNCVDLDLAQKGGYVISYEQNKKELHGILIATGSEVELCLKAQKIMQDDGLSIRVISMPCKELFLRQGEKYINKVLREKNRCRLVVEAGATAGWYKLVGLDGAVLGVDDFGETGKQADLYKKFNLTLTEIIKQMDKLIKHNQTIVESIII